MLETIGINLFVLVVLSIWSNSDIRTGEVHNLALAIPLIFGFIWNPGLFIAIFVPMFVVLAGFFLAVRKKGLFGFADVIGLPFVLVFLTYLNVFGIIAFLGMFSCLMLVSSREKFDRVLKRKIYSRIPLMPVLLLSYFVGFLIHLVFVLIS